jgi:hypothetical protein
MTAITIDRLIFKLSGVSEQDGQRLSRLIAEGLGTMPISTQESRHLDAMRVNVRASPGSSLDMLSRQVVAEILRQLERPF